VRLQPLGAVGALLCLAIGVAAVFGPYLLPYHPDAPSTQVQIAPSAQHWFGTDNFGRDYFSRTVAGARTSIAVAGVAIALGVGVGALLGMISANRAGWFDMVFQRVVDTFLALPALILAMFFVAVFGASLKNLILVLSITVIPPVIRVARGSSLLVEQQPYIEAARVIGVPVPRLLLRHVLPNIAAPLLVILTTGIGALILAEAGLSFLGLGIRPPTAEWGQMLSASRPLALQAPWLPIFPGVAISLAVLAFNLLGDALRDLWDPRLRSR
jgi:peptide/nickel transport system permease protein